MCAGDLVHPILRGPHGHGSQVGQHERDGSPRERGAPPALQPGDERGRRCTATRRIGGQIRAHNPLQRRDPLALDRAPARGAAGGRLARQQRDGGRGERVDVRRRGRPRPRRDLGCCIASRARPAHVVGGHGGQSEVGEDNPARAGADQVGRLDVSVHDGRVVRVQVLQCLGGLLEVAERETRIEPRAAVDVEQRLEVRTLDPVHRDDVSVVHEEVLADQREPWMG
jgi:hypothetical protein